MPLPWHRLTGLIINVFVFFMLNCYFRSLESPGRIQVLGKKLKSSGKTFCMRVRFLAK
jgi:hypothetical protein